MFGYIDIKYELILIDHRNTIGFFQYLTENEGVENYTFYK